MAVFSLVFLSLLWVGSNSFEPHSSPQENCLATEQRGVTAQSLAHMRSAAAVGQAVFTDDQADVDLDAEEPDSNKPSLNIIAVVQTCATCEGNKVIPSYDAFFQAVVSWFWADQPSQDDLKLVMSNTSGRWQFSCGGGQYDKGRYRTAYVTLCMPKLIAELPKAFPDAQGMMTFHSDFWIQPAVMFGSSPPWAGAFGKLWHLGQGLADPVSPDWDKNMVLVPYPYCFESAAELAAHISANGSRWNWGSPCPWQELDELTVALSKAPHQRAQCCAGWADAWYLPVEAWEDFLSVTTHYQEGHFFTTLNHEVMVHTLLEFLARHRGHPLQAMTECWGSCCSDIKGDYAKLESYACGHKIDLAKPNASDAMIAMLQQQALQFSSTS